jgi:hypothetical protein
VEGHVRARHGLCPPEVLAHLAELLAARERGEPVVIGQAFSLVAQAHVRHAFTDYDRLLRIPVATLEEALLIVRPEAPSPGTGCVAGICPPSYRARLASPA